MNTPDETDNNTVQQNTDINDSEWKDIQKNQAFIVKNNLNPFIFAFYLCTKVINNKNCFFSPEDV